MYALLETTGCRQRQINPVVVTRHPNGQAEVKASRQPDVMLADPSSRLEMQNRPKGHHITATTNPSLFLHCVLPIVLRCASLVITASA